MISGIYKIVNTINRSIYIGSTINLVRREHEHFYSLKNDFHHSKILQRAFNKYGRLNFKFEVIEECEVEKLLEREQYYIDTLKPSYNVSKIAGRIDLPKEIRDIIASKLRGRKMSDEFRKNTSEGLKRAYRENPQYRERLSKLNKGKRHSQETIEKLRKISTGKKQSQETISKRMKFGPWNKGKKMSKEYCEIISKSTKGRKHSQKTKDIMSQKAYFRIMPSVTCPHCGKEGNKGAMTVWHFDNCKFRKEAA